MQEELNCPASPVLVHHGVCSASKSVAIRSGDYPATRLSAVNLCRAGARVLFPPPYSPDLNPIEQVFSTLKNTLRKAMGRSIQAIEAAIAKAIKAIAKQECRNYLTNAGYASA